MGSKLWQRCGQSVRGRSGERLLPGVRADGWGTDRTGLLRDGARHYRLGSHRILAGHRAPPSAKTSREAGSARWRGSCTVSSRNPSTLTVTATMVVAVSCTDEGELASIRSTVGEAPGTYRSCGCERCGQE